MSIIANYVRIRPDLLPVCKSDPKFCQQKIESSIANGRHFDLDQHWDAIAWMASPTSRQKSDCAYQWLRVAEGDIDDIPPNPSDIPTDDIERCIKGGETKIPQIDFGHGQPCVLSPGEVVESARLLNDISADELRKQFDPAQMVGVHPDGWQNSDPDVLENTLIPSFACFQEFVSSAANDGDALIVFFN